MSLPSLPTVMARRCGSEPTSMEMLLDTRPISLCSLYLRRENWTLSSNAHFSTRSVDDCFSLTHFKYIYSSSSVKNWVKTSAVNHCSLVLSLYLISYLPSLSSLHSSSCSLHLHLHSFIFTLLSPSLHPSLSLSLVCLWP